MLFFSFLKLCKHYSGHTKTDIVLFLSSKYVISRFNTSELWQKKYLCWFYSIYLYSLLKILMTNFPSKSEWSKTPALLPSSHEFQWLSCYIHIQILWVTTDTSYKTWLSSHHSWFRHTLIQTYWYWALFLELIIFRFVP